MSKKVKSAKERISEANNAVIQSRKEVRSGKKIIEVGKYSADLLRFVLVRHLAQHQNEERILEIAKERELTETEGWLLPSNLFNLARQQLIEKIEEWQTTIEELEWWIKELTF